MNAERVAMSGELAEAVTESKTARPRSGGGRPTRYMLADGKTRVPGVTTITSKYKDASGLIHWAWKQGCDGLDYRNTRDAAADAGHIAHAWIEDSLHGIVPRQAFPDAAPDTVARAETAFSAFEDWRKMVSLEVVVTELPLVSELHRFGGTLDAIALVKGVPTLLDWKSGSGVYPEVISQLAAYRQLVRESVGAKRYTAPEAACCLRVGKEMGDWHTHYYPSAVLDAGWRRFLGARMIYDEDLMLSKVCT